MQAQQNIDAGVMLDRYAATTPPLKLIKAITWLIWFPLVTSRSSSKQI